MKSRSRYLLVGCLLSACVSASGMTPTVALVGLENKSCLGRFALMGDSLLRLMAADISRAQGVRVVERERIDLMLRELDLGKTGLLDPAHVIKMGEALPADYYVVGALEVTLASGSRLADARLDISATVRHVPSQRTVVTIGACGLARE